MDRRTECDLTAGMFTLLDGGRFIGGTLGLHGIRLEWALRTVSGSKRLCAKEHFIFAGKILTGLGNIGEPNNGYGGRVNA